MDISLPRLRDAIADPEPELAYREARLQYESLLRTPTATSGSVNLMLYYRTLFENATQTLEEGDWLKLLHLCFAYKKQQTILTFLDDVNEKLYTWVPKLRTMVAERGRDTLFDETATREQDQQQQSPRLQTRMQLRSSTMSISKKSQDPYFVIPTLCLAYPSDFCTAFASHARINMLTTPNLLACPAMVLMNLSLPLKETLRIDNLSQGTSIFNAQQQGSWVALLDHLLQAQEKLFDHYFRRPALDDKEGPYEEEDLALWLAKWVGNRQMKALQEEGEEIQTELEEESNDRVAGRRSSAAELTEERQTTEDVVQGEQATVVEDTGRGQRKSGRWADVEELDSIMEIPAREKKKK